MLSSCEKMLSQSVESGLQARPAWSILEKSYLTGVFKVLATLAEANSLGVKRSKQIVSWSFAESGISTEALVNIFSLDVKIKSLKLFICVGIDTNCVRWAHWEA